MYMYLIVTLLFVLTVYLPFGVHSCVVFIIVFRVKQLKVSQKKTNRK